MDALRYIVLQAPQAVALDLYNNLPGDISAQESFRAAMVPLFLQRGAIEVAEKGMREVATPTAGPDVQLELLRTLCCRPGPGRLAEARRIFADLVAAKADGEALDALLL